MTDHGSPIQPTFARHICWGGARSLPGRRRMSVYGAYSHRQHTRSAVSTNWSRGAGESDFGVNPWQSLPATLTALGVSPPTWIFTWCSRLWICPESLDWRESTQSSLNPPQLTRKLTPSLVGRELNQDSRLLWGWSCVIGVSRTSSGVDLVSLTQGDRLTSQLRRRPTGSLAKIYSSVRAGVLSNNGGYPSGGRSRSVPDRNPLAVRHCPTTTGPGRELGGGHVVSRLVGETLADVRHAGTFHSVIRPFGCE